MNKKGTLVVGILSISSAFSATLQVPEDYATIQTAINVASSGDKIIVAPGTYVEGIDFSGKNIVLTSQDPNDPEIVGVTILKPALVKVKITGRNPFIEVPYGPVVQFTQGETSDAVLTGFTITEGVGKMIEGFDLNSELLGAGIYCENSSPQIIGNVITGNGNSDDQTSYMGGGGICCWNSEALISRNVIANNYSREGGGILVRFGQPIITQNRIEGNSADWNGGGIYCWGGSEAEITRNIITANYANEGGGINFGQGYLSCNVIDKNRAYQGGGIALYGTGKVIHNTVVANAADWGGNVLIYSWSHDNQSSQFVNNIVAWANTGGGILWYEQGEGISEGLLIQFNAIWQNNKDEAFQKLLSSDQDGTWLAPSDDIWGPYNNIYAEPGFVDRVAGDYHLRPDSPCINAGDPQYVPLAGQTDVDGEERVYSWQTDIGADEYVGYIWPTAQAGEDQHVPEPDIWITLDGSNSRIHDPCATTDFRWIQTSGPDVELVGADTSQPQFLPTIDGAYGFELVVSDDQRESHPDMVAVVVGPVQTHANRVEWSISDQGNGHLYQPIRCPGGILWEDADVRSKLAGGYMSTITSAEENLFVFELINDMDKYWIPVNCSWRKGPWLGAFQPAGSQEPAGGWTWVTGEPFEYTAWQAKNPTGIRVGRSEDRLNFYSRNGGPAPTWGDNFSDTNDVLNMMLGYVTEYDPVDWQAELMASIQGGHTETSYSGYTGDGYVVLDSNADPAGDVSIQWDIQMGPRGSRKLSIRYAQNTGEPVETTLKINDVVLAEPLVLPDTGAWDNWTVVSVPVCFEPGMNHLLLSTKQPGSKLNLDQLSFVDENTNLALNKRINFSNHLGGQSAAHAVDGDRYSVWNAAGFPQWIEIDLEDDYSVRRTQLIWMDDGIYQYQIEAKSSLDSEYTCIVDATQNVGSGTFLVPLIDDIDPGSVSARYVRLTVLGKLEGSGKPEEIGLAEFRVNAAIDTPSACPGSPQSEEPDQPSRDSNRR